MNIKGIFFDFDNTIVDDYLFIIECFNYSFSKAGIVVKPNDLEKLIGKSQKEIIHSFLKTEDLLKNGMKDFDDYYIDNYKKNIKLFEGIYKLLEILSSKYLLGLITGAPREKVDLVSEYFNIQNFFSSIITQNDVSAHKPDPEGVLLTLKKLNLKSHEIIYIGDADEDIDILDSIDIKFIKSDWGDRRTFTKQSDTYLSSKYPLEILKMIKSLEIL